ARRRELRGARGCGSPSRLRLNLTPSGGTVTARWAAVGPPWPPCYLPARFCGCYLERERSSNMMRKHFRIRRIVIGLAFAAIVAPAAQAQTYYVDGGPAPVSYVTPLQADGMRLQAMANAYQSQAASRAATNLGP